jgi:hypothetical protein
MTVIKFSDPVYAMIESHKALSIACDEAVDPAILDCLASDLVHLADRLFAFRPPTSAGVASLLRYISSLEVWQMPACFSEPREIEGMKSLCGSLAAALEGRRQDGHASKTVIKFPSEAHP